MSQLVTCAVDRLDDEVEVHVAHQDVARAGTSRSAVSRDESGGSSPSVETLDRLLAVGSQLELVDDPGFTLGRR